MDVTTTDHMSYTDRDAPAIQLIESVLFYHMDRDTPVTCRGPYWKRLLWHTQRSSTTATSSNEGR
jgi:hypothetical protein